jgi:hypothetical protein
VTGEFVRFEYRAPGLLAPVLLAVHALVAILLITTLPWNAILLGALLYLGTSAAWLVAHGRHAVKGAWFELDANGGCRLEDTQFNTEGRLRTDSVALPWLIVLRLDLESHRWPTSLIVFPRSMHAEDWRHLQVFLKWGVRFGVSAASTPSAAPY